MLDSRLTVVRQSETSPNLIAHSSSYYLNGF